MADEDKRLTPMDATAREGEYVSAVAARKCYAMEQLIEEVETVFPETTYQESGRNLWGVALDIQFVPGPDDADDLGSLLSLLGDPAYSEDSRIVSVTVEDVGVLVSFRDYAPVFDLRDEFGLVEAYAVLSGGAL